MVPEEHSLQQFRHLGARVRSARSLYVHATEALMLQSENMAKLRTIATSPFKLPILISTCCTANAKVLQQPFAPSLKVNSVKSSRGSV